MASTTPLQDLFEKNKFDRNIHLKSTAWFDGQVLQLAKKRITPQQVIRNKPSNIKSSIIPGNLYMFLYDAKHKETLPYWDKFPLVFPFRATADGFYGLNLHYLPYRYRAILMDRLLMFKNNSKFDETTKLKYSWSMIAGMSKFEMAKPCVKQYLKTQVRSQFVKVDANDWTTALMLPVERFVGASKGVIWADSRESFK
ncbi:DNA end protector protein [uncultured Caudovirales phage]|uniref:DNA end protector protein n=1 Tax=uncultured Caudovirales phage TaxID=2100421 RepID=A0A6J5KU87_9CAUD|nr:DNA end protector protein [uncultured Caudovirales phage]